jgi:hypothetical protein
MKLKIIPLGKIRKTNITCFHSYVEYRHNNNSKIITWLDYKRGPVEGEKREDDGDWIWSNSIIKLSKEVFKRRGAERGFKKE